MAINTKIEKTVPGTYIALMVDVVSERQFELSQIFRRTQATYREAEDLINIGAYVQGSNPEIDYALSKNPLMHQFVMQSMKEQTSLHDCEAQLEQIFGDYGDNSA